MSVLLRNVEFLREFLERQREHLPCSSVIGRLSWSRVRAMAGPHTSVCAAGSCRWIGEGRCAGRRTGSAGGTRSSVSIACVNSSRSMRGCGGWFLMIITRAISVTRTGARHRRVARRRNDRCGLRLALGVAAIRHPSAPRWPFASRGSPCPCRPSEHDRLTRIKNPFREAILRLGPVVSLWRASCLHKLTL